VEWWIFVRRIACGLKPGQQRQFFQDVSTLILPGKTGGTKLSEQERVEIWMALANMERLLVKDKITCGRGLLPRITSKNCKPQYLWTLSRLGAREPLYGSADRVIPPAEAAKWIETIIDVQWSHLGDLDDAWADRITEVRPVEQQEQSLTYGESLPAGLILRDA